MLELDSDVSGEDDAALLGGAGAGSVLELHPATAMASAVSAMVSFFMLMSFQEGTAKCQGLVSVVGFVCGSGYASQVSHHRRSNCSSQGMVIVGHSIAV